MMTETEIIGVRDPHGFRPLALGRLKEGAYVLASETCAFDLIEAKFIREITFLDRDILGFWEVRGYSNTADPWREDRFAKPQQPPPGFFDPV